MADQQNWDKGKDRATQQKSSEESNNNTTQHTTSHFDGIENNNIDDVCARFSFGNAIPSSNKTFELPPRLTSIIKSQQRALDQIQHQQTQQQTQLAQDPHHQEREAIKARMKTLESRLNNLSPHSFFYRRFPAHKLDRIVIINPQNNKVVHIIDKNRLGAPEWISANERLEYNAKIPIEYVHFKFETQLTSADISTNGGGSGGGTKSKKSQRKVTSNKSRKSQSNGGRTKSTTQSIVGVSYKNKNKSRRISGGRDMATSNNSNIASAHS